MGVGVGVKVGHKVGFGVGVGFRVGFGEGVAVGQGVGIGVGVAVHIGFMVGVSSFVVAETELSSKHIAEAVNMIRTGAHRSKILVLLLLLYVGGTSSPFKQKKAEVTVKL